MKLYTVTIDFADHSEGVEQYQARSPEEALHCFIEQAVSLAGNDRNMVKEALLAPSLLHLAKHKGIWIVLFSPVSLSKIIWHNNNPILGGLVIQSDPEGEIRRG